MTLLRGVGLLGSFLTVVALGGCSGAAQEVGSNTAPLAKEVTVIAQNPAHVGATLQGGYRYLDTDGDEQSGTLLAWLRDGQPIDGANQTNYLVVAEDSGKKLQFRVTPAAASGKSPGVSVASEERVIANSAPTVTGVTIDAPLVGATSILQITAGNQLSVKFKYHDVDDDPTAIAGIRWLRRAAESTDETPIPNEISSTYTVTSADIGRSLVAEVTPLASRGIEQGAAVRSQAVLVVDAVNSNPVAQNVQIKASATPAIVGSKLTASYIYFDVDGDPEALGGSTIQWRNGSDIMGATKLEYILTPADSGKAVTVQVTPKSGKGTSPGLAVESKAITVVNSAPQVSNVVVNVNGTSAVSALVGDVLNASYNYSDLDLNSEGKSTYRWLRSGTSSSTPIANATGRSYQISVADSGTNLVFEVTPVALQGESPGLAVSSSPMTIKNSPPVARNVQAQLSPGNTITPINVGSVLEAKYTYFDADNDLERTGANGTTIQWFRNGIAITGATGTGPTYTLVAADVGIATTVTLSFDVTPVSADGTKGNATRSSGISSNNVAPTATNVNITIPPPGTAVVGTQLTGTYVYSDADGDAEATGGSLYEWSNGTRVLGTAKDYSVKAVDAHQTLTFKVTPAAKVGTSPGTAVTSPGVAIDNSAPSVTGLVINSSSVDGRAYKDVKLTASYSFQDPDGDLEGATSYQWLRSTTLTGATPIGGATQQSYTVVYPIDIDAQLTVQVTPRDNVTPAKAGTPVVSPVAITPVNLAPVASNVVIAPKTPQVGDVLSVTYIRTDLEGDLEPLTGSSIQWLRNKGAIMNATSAVYTLVEADMNQTIAAQVTPLSTTGTKQGAGVESNAISIPNNTAPVAQNVTLSPSAAVAGTLLTGSYTYFDAEGNPEGQATFRWLKNNTAINGAIGPSYKVTSADVGQSIVFEVTPYATKGILAGVAALSKGIAISSSYAIGGTVSGLAAGASIVLLNGVDQVTVSANGPFLFAPTYPNGTPYNVTIQAQPTNQPTLHQHLWGEYRQRRRYYQYQCFLRTTAGSNVWLGRNAGNRARLPHCDNVA